MARNQDDYTSSPDESGGSGVGAKKFVAAGFLVVIVGLAAVLFVVTRGGEDDGASDSSDSAIDTSKPLSEQFEWEGKEADPLGTMVYFPKDEKGQPLSDSVRDYSDDPEAAASGTPSETLFQTTTFAAGTPIPFSTEDGPTGFDGTVPIGYSKSGAGAALAAAAYANQISPIRGTYAEFAEKGFIDPTSEFLEKSERREKEQGREPEEQGELFSQAYVNYTVDAFDGDYARISIYRQYEDTPAAFSLDLRWDTNTWKLDGNLSVPSKVDRIPEEAHTWKQ